MSSKSKDGHSSGGFHQEYIASLRYRNDLPPPDMPPKFLDIPHEGLSRFLTPGFASNLARREEPNIEVDAEGGMPIDLVGIPGLHLGDESAIMAPENPQPMDPADLPLLLTIEQLRNPAPRNTNVSFLRRTQHIGVDRSAGDGSRAAPLKTQSRTAKKGKPAVDDPKHVKKFIQKGFDIAYPQSKHSGEDTESHIRGLPPQRPNLMLGLLKPVGFFPIIPDLEGFPDPGGYLQFKFDKAPVGAVRGKRDARMDVGILTPVAPEERVCQQHQAKVDLHTTNPALYPHPGPVPYDYQLFLPEKPQSVKNIHTSMNLNSANRDNEDLYTNESADGSKFHRYDRARTYATSAQVFNTEQKDIALTLFKPNDGDTRQLAAYYYPISGKARLKPERARTIAQAGLAPTSTQQEESEERIDQMQVTMRDPNEAEIYKRALTRLRIDPKFASNMPPEPVVQEEQSMEHEETERADDDTRMSDDE
ncbi:RNA polymerase II-associated Paf1 [Penicillium paradoxum]|uniref:RNA polymerase II-associated Paf1 n=1 Tax=Penicillium paradoxum TaxID=176176 RepID=UPI002549158A|nr:RNA polymerase II-associated Paf1 [Penicillium paradoxum]KAJ5787501.1 RNA polymerase II-associated Paf1 [Penicillium paradoxum]